MWFSNKNNKCLGPFVQSVVSLMSSFRDKMLTALLSTLKNVSSLQMQKLLNFFSSQILAYMPYLMIKVLTNGIVSFEQMGSGQVAICTNTEFEYCCKYYLFKFGKFSLDILNGRAYKNSFDFFKP